MIFAIFNMYIYALYLNSGWIIRDILFAIYFQFLCAKSIMDLKQWWYKQMELWRLLNVHYERKVWENMETIEDILNHSFDLLQLLKCCILEDQRDKAFISKKIIFHQLKYCLSIYPMIF